MFRKRTADNGSPIRDAIKEWKKNIAYAALCNKSWPRFRLKLLNDEGESNLNK